MFNSIENKRMVWNLLLAETNPALINNKQFQNYFEKLITQIEVNKQRFPKLVDMNKELLTLSLQAIRTMTQHTQPQKEKKKYQNRLLEKQKELKIMKEGGAKPKEIDFTMDNNTDFGDINVLMSKSQEQRTRELESITHTYKSDDALKWISSKNPSSVDSTNVISDQVPKLVIHDSSNDKKVSFNLENKKSNICVKLSYTENGMNKTMICSLSNGFRVFMSPHGKIEQNANSILENVELFTS